MAKKNASSVSEEQLLKALGALEAQADEDEEEEVVKGDDESESDEEDEEDDEESESDKKSAKKSVSGLPGDVDEANGGGFDGEADLEGDGSENFELEGEENDPTESAKSMRSAVRENETLRKGFEISPFLESLTDATVTAVDGVAKSQAEFQAEQRAFNLRLQKAVVAIGNHVLGIHKSQAEALEEPVVVQPRSIVRKSQVSERFAQSEEAPQYTREQTLEALTQLAMDGKVTPVAVSAYEATNFVDPAYTGLVNNALKSMYPG